MTEDLRETHLDEEDWSSESAGRSEQVSRSEVDEKLAEGQTVSLSEVAQDVRARFRERTEEEDVKTRVLTVTELEDLFINAAPDLKGRLSFVLIRAC